MSQPNTSINTVRKTVNQPQEVINMSLAISNTQNNPQHKESTMSVANTTAELNGAEQLASLAIWNEQLVGAERMIKRGLRYHGIKSTGMIIKGDAGTGKTHFAKKLKEELTARSVTIADHDTMPVLMISAPQQSKVPDMIQKLLYELGDIKPNQGKHNDKLNRLFRLLNELKVELIIVDEIHDYLPKKGNSKNSAALSFLKLLMDEALIPILFMGTEKASMLSTMSDELGSRLRYSYTFSKLPYGVDDFSKKDFAEMATAFAEYLPQQNRSLNFVMFNECGVKFNNTKLLDRLYVATNGLPRGLRDLFLEINIEMEDDSDFSPSLDSLARIYAGLESMNNYIDFNPFTVKSKTINAYIGNASATQGDINEAA
ncbi:TniB family NTP-binding protein [Paraglaciecola chathamensis]|uniref:AAA+ ATPase domain-containing protein n=1 Tax=Paraglaciecola chathamensis S18K6 TaxID=1127672 RepID=A0AAV3UUE3_9ALTE|nr:TniB family NTP-binding protein [Paraglaciecola chathamensis]GAC08535.1 hypothetical protein GCHA_0572 [Paraglaciecola chathamensis S18K6]